MSRAILVAGFDAQSIVDEAVVLLVAELARWGDVFYLADNWLPEEELAKLAPHTSGAWAIRHGAYDFGSYSLLARELVGWDTISTYDELLFVNDSSFLLRPLDEVFAEMERRECDWWGLQATKGLASTADQPSTRFTTAIPLHDVRDRLLARWESDEVYDFHVGSYFLAFRRPVIADPEFRALIDSVGREEGKLEVVLKYEVGLTRLLIRRGHRFDTLVPVLHPFHPLFTETHFELIADGFPLLKRYLLARNHYDVPGLDRWKERILELVPDAPVDVFEAALVRTTPDDRLRRSLHVRADADGRPIIPGFVRGPAFRRRDAELPKDPSVWAFVVDPTTGQLPPSVRAVFEQVRHEESLTKVILTRGSAIDLPGPNVRTVPIIDPASRDELYRAGAVFARSAPARTVRAPILPEHHVIVAMRDGLTLAAEGPLAAPPADPGRRPPARPDEPLVWVHPLEPSPLTAFATTSDADQIAASAVHSPARYAQGWRTGLPSHDLLLTDELPSDLAEEEQRLRALAGGRRVVLLLPAPYAGGDPAAHHHFSDAFGVRLGDLLAAHDAVLAIREDVGDLDRAYTRQLGGQAIDASFLRYASTQAVLRATDLVWTDFRSETLDFTLTGRPVVSFVPPELHAEERTVYDLDHLFPGPVVTEEEGLLGTLDDLLGDADPSASTRYRRFRDLFLDHRDAGSAARVVARVRTELQERRS